MRLDHRTTLTLVGIFVIAGLCAGGYSAVGHEGLSGKVDVSGGGSLGGVPDSSHGLLELRRLGKKYDLLLGKLAADAQSKPSTRAAAPDMVDPATAPDHIKCAAASDPGCAAVPSPDLGSMGGTVPLPGEESEKHMIEHAALVYQDQEDLRRVIVQMQNVVRQYDIKGLEARYASVSAKTSRQMQTRAAELDSWREKIADMRAQIDSLEGAAENDRLSGRSSFYFYMTWLAAAVVMCGAAFGVINNPILVTVAIALALWIAGSYAYGLAASSLADAEASAQQAAESVSLDGVLGR